MISSTSLEPRQWKGSALGSAQKTRWLLILSGRYGKQK